MSETTSERTDSTSQPTRRSDRSDQHLTKRYGWRFAAIPGVLVLIYGMLSFISLGDQDFFYESMEINVPDNEFLLWSWGGKNTAMLTVLLVAAITRLRVLLVTAMAVLFVGQMGDVNAGAQSGVNVFITWIAFSLVVIQSVWMFLDWRAEQKEMPATVS
ncbi:MAG: hypothetical protein AAF945_11315 [Actinomycetota bacterium]